jgi:hypothetical protein
MHANRYVLAAILTHFLSQWASAAAQPAEIKFTKEEAEFLAQFAEREKNVNVMRGLFVVSVGAAFPMSPDQYVDFFTTNAVGIALDAPSVNDALKGLGQIQRARAIEDLQLFINKKPPPKNLKFFQDLLKRYDSKWYFVSA